MVTKGNRDVPIDETDIPKWSKLEPEVVPDRNGNRAQRRAWRRKYGRAVPEGEVS